MIAKTRVRHAALIPTLALACALVPAAAAATEGRDGPTSTLYTGRVGERAVTMYLKSEPAPCGGEHRLISAIYRYDGVSKWLLLEAREDRKGHLALVESSLATGISGALMLTGKDGGLRGKWISPDGERVLPVELRKADLPVKKRQQMDEALGKAEFDNDDC